MRDGGCAQQAGGPAPRSRRAAGRRPHGARPARVRRAGGLLLAAALLAAPLGCDLRQPIGTWLAGDPELVEEAPPPSSVRGRLAVSLHGGGAGGPPPVTHQSTWVVGPRYDGMEDNDLRGFLDGRFIYGWNQPTQVHTRLGRRESSPRWGETELFRTLQRWGDVVLPAGAQVRSAELEIHVEEGPRERERGLDILLYAVHEDWDPGRGGEPGHNNAPPEKGDVWWDARAEGEEGWGLPGVGFASANHPAADTPAEPLAETRWEPGEPSFTFRSAELAAYAERRATQGAPLLFLLKLDDVLEDVPDTVLRIWSANADDLENPGRRPQLRLTWTAASPSASLTRRMHLEHAHTLALPRLEVAGRATLAAASFRPDPGHEAPTIRVRGGDGRGGAPSPWRPLEATLPVDWRWMELELVAASNPHPLGEPFETRFRDTWIRSAPPEAQRVPFTFVSPQGARHTVLAEYAGDWTWTVRFEPRELGRWRYQYETAFLKKDRTARSGAGSFDVVLEDRESARRALRDLLERARAVHEETGEPPGGTSALARSFWKLERAVLRLETPEHWRSEEGRALRRLLDDVREALSGRRPPPELAPKGMKREW